MVTCAYCGESTTDPSVDHIFPQFLGGERTIHACRSCNSKFGHTFEGKVADALEPIYVQLAYWGVPLVARQRWWRSAYCVEGATLDLAVGSQGLLARSSHPIIIKDGAGSVTAAYFERERDLELFQRVTERRKPDAQWIPDEKRVTTNLKGLRWSLELGPCLQQMALKMCVAASTLLPNLQHEDRVSATRSLREIPSGPHDCVAQYMHLIEAITAKRPALAHTLYVEHDGVRAQGFVEFFGTFPLFINLCHQSERLGRDAILGYLDPVSEDEHFEMVEPIGLPPPPSFYTAQEIIQHQITITARLIQSARLRGATVNPDVALTARLPDNPVFPL